MILLTLNDGKEYRFIDELKLKSYLQDRFGQVVYSEKGMEFTENPNLKSKTIAYTVDINFKRIAPNTFDANKYILNKIGEILNDQ